jgi:hypothetical protein
MAAPTFTAHRRASADGERRGERFDDGNHRPDYAVFVIDRVHHLGHAVAFRFRREVGDDERNAEAADHRHQNNERAPRMGRREDARIVSDGNLTKK